jgi:hypothetical protein
MDWKTCVWQIVFVKFQETIKMTETTHEALLRQTAATEEMLAYFQGQREGFQDEVSEAQAAYAALGANLFGIVDDKLTTSFWVDAVSGDNANDGNSSGAPLATFDEAANRINPGAYATILLAKDQVHDLASCRFDNNHIIIRDFGAGTNRPIWSGVYDGSHPTIEGTTAVVADNSVIFFSAVDVRTPIAARTGAGGAGIINTNSTVTVRTVFTNFELGDFHFLQNMKGFSPSALGTYHTTVNRLAGHTQLSKLMQVNLGSFGAAITSVPSGETISDYLNIIRNGAGDPINFVSNIAL